MSSYGKAQNGVMQAGRPARGQDANISRLSAVALGVVSGLLLGWVIMETADSMFTTGAGSHLHFKDKAAGLRNKVGSLIAEELGMHRKGAGAGAGSSVAVVKPKTSSLHKGTTIHSVMTSSGSAYQNFQGRIMYGTYLLVQQMPGGEVLTGFTRILHRVHEDECMDEIPTFHAQPLHPACDTWCDFPVADRPNAVTQWIHHVQQDPSQLKGAWVALLECDYVWMKPLPSPGDAHLSNAPGWQYHFGYIMSQHPDCAHIIKRLYDGGDPANVPNSGPAPALLRFTELEKVTPLWEQITATIEGDKEAVKVLGWVREMYAWDIAIAQSGVKVLTEDPPKSPLIAQPPADHTIGNASMFHYTWGAEYSNSSGKVWTWDKRTYTDQKFALKPVPIPLPPAPWGQDKWQLQEFFGRMSVPQDMHETLTSMIVQMNKAIANLPDLTDKFNALKATQSLA